MKKLNAKKVDIRTYNRQISQSIKLNTTPEKIGTKLFYKAVTYAIYTVNNLYVIKEHFYIKDSSTNRYRLPRKGEAEWNILRIKDNLANF